MRGRPLHLASRVGLRRRTCGASSRVPSRLCHDPASLAPDPPEVARLLPPPRRWSRAPCSRAGARPPG
eukprot:scaffold8094_cov376-Prasinococcus_capsulatus_cf.AAC.7